MAGRGGYHVVPDGEAGWAVRRAGGMRATSLHPSQVEAIEAARSRSARSGSGLIVHGPDGRFLPVDVPAGRGLG